MVVMVKGTWCLSLQMCLNIFHSKMTLMFVMPIGLDGCHGKMIFIGLNCCHSKMSLIGIDGCHGKMTLIGLDGVMVK